MYGVIVLGELLRGQCGAATDDGEQALTDQLRGEDLADAEDDLRNHIRRPCLSSARRAGRGSGVERN